MITAEMDTEEALQVIKESAELLIRTIDAKEAREYMFRSAWSLLEDNLKSHYELMMQVGEIKGYGN